MHAILATMGTDGDVFPFLAIGSALLARGHRITLAANERYERLAHDHGFGFHALIASQVDDQLFSNPDFWRPFKGPLLGARIGSPLIGGQCSLLAELAGGNDTVLIASAGVFAAPIIHERFSVPMATIVCQPWLIPSALAPPAVPGGLSLPPWVPLGARRLYFTMIDAIGGRLVGNHINAARASFGLERVRGVFPWWFSPELVIGLFPPWYAPPEADWPTQIRLAGFPLYDGNPDGELPTDLVDFCHASSPPIVFTFGTGMLHATETFQVAVEACRELGMRGILLTKHADQISDPLPVDVRHVPFAPLRSLLPLCSAIVHHGGIGTTSQALATGTPQLVLPLAWDQPDNARRVKQLGAGDWLARHRRSTSHVANALSRLMTPTTRTRCTQVARYFEGCKPLETVADWIEELDGRSSCRKARSR